MVLIFVMCALASCHSSPKIHFISTYEFHDLSCGRHGRHILWSCRRLLGSIVLPIVPFTHIWLILERADARSIPFLLFVHASDSPKICFRTPPPPTHTFLKWPFLTDFKKCTHTPPPPTPRERYFGASDEEFKNPEKTPKPTKLAHNEPQRYSNIFGKGKLCSKHCRYANSYAKLLFLSHWLNWFLNAHNKY